MVEPLFIFGIARGGTNLIARALAEHKQIVMALDILMPLLKLWRNLAYDRGLPEPARCRFDPGAPFQDFYFNPDGPALLNTLLSAHGTLEVTSSMLVDLREAVAARAALERPDRAESLRSLTGATIGDILTHLISIVQSWGERDGKASVLYAGFKEVWTVDFLPALARHFPTAKFVIIHRDPRAVVMSLLAMAKKDPTQLAHPISYMRHWRKQVELTLQFSATPEYAARLTSVRFEDLCDRPREELARICALLNIDVETAMLQPGGEWEGNSSYGPRQADIDTGAIDRWRVAIDPVLLETVDFHCGREMRLTGYVPESEGTTLTAGIVETVRHFDANPGKWRSDFGDWETGLAWECLRRALSLQDEHPLANSLRQKCYLRVEKSR